MVYVQASTTAPPIPTAKTSTVHTIRLRKLARAISAKSSRIMLIRMYPLRWFPTTIGTKRLYVFWLVPAASSPNRAVMRISLRLGFTRAPTRRGFEERITSSSLLTMEISPTPRRLRRCT